MLLKALVLATILMSSACAAEKFTPDQISQIQGAPSIVFLHQTHPPLHVLTERNMIPVQVGLLPELVASIVRGTATPVSLGADVKARGTLTDPAASVQEHLKSGLKEKLGISNVSSLDVAQEDIGPSHLSSVIQGNLIIAFKTTFWALTFYSMDTSFHYLVYAGEARLIDLAKGDVLWSAACKFKGDEPKNHRHTLEELVADDAKLLSLMLDSASRSCATELIGQMI